MPRIVGVRFHGRGKVFDCDAGDLDIQQGDSVIVSTRHGLDLGIAAHGVREGRAQQQEVHEVLRLATEADEALYDEHCQAEREAYRVCRERIEAHDLDMQLVAVEYTFDEQKILFYFTSEHRVDFRALVRDLASIFHRRIELRQIGVRDEARMLGGLGSCGRPFCCASFLPDFVPVSIKMAKAQGLSMNPTKISGACGRLMCCLKYEQEAYEEARKRAPRQGSQVRTADGEGRVLQVNLIKEEALVQISEQDSLVARNYPISELRWQSQKRGRDQEGGGREVREPHRSCAGTENHQGSCCGRQEGGCACPRKKRLEEANPEDSQLVLSSEGLETEGAENRRRRSQRRRGGRRRTEDGGRKSGEDRAD